MILRSPAACVAMALFCAGALACRSSAQTKNQGGASNADAAALPTFVEDDYPEALRRAKAEHLPLFVDAWAPWCHTCLSMKAYVFGDPALAEVTPKFVWASIDTEKSASDPFTKKFPMEVWPTLWVIDPVTEKPVLKWLGSATASELSTLLEQATTAQSGAGPGAIEATAAWLRGNHAVAEGHPDVAVREYRESLARAPQGFRGRPAVVEAYVAQLQALAQNDECLATSLREWPPLPRGTSRLNVVLAALSCASSLPKSSERHDALEALAREASRIATDPSEPVLADDRSSLFEELVSFLRWNDDPQGARSVAEKWDTFLAGEAARAPTPAARAVFDSHRMEAMSELGQGERAIPMLEQSERDFPDDYNAPTRLAKVNLELGRLPAALSAVGRAEGKVYGPRKMRVLWIKADILKAMKRPDESRRALAEALQLGEHLELTGGYQKLVTKIRERLAEP